MIYPKTIVDPFSVPVDKVEELVMVVVEGEQTLSSRMYYDEADQTKKKALSTVQAPDRERVTIVT